MEQMQLSLNVTFESIDQAVARYWANRQYQIVKYVDSQEANNE